MSQNLRRTEPVFGYSYNMFCWRNIFSYLQSAGSIENAYIMDLTTNGVVITDAIKFVQTNKEKLTMSTKKEDKDSKESKEPDYDEDKDQLEEKQEQENGELEEETTNQVF
jgi:hypothetical protein